MNKQRIAVLKGNGTSSLSYGAIWHFFETQLHYPITSVDTDYFKRISLDKYDVLIIPEGYYTNILNDEILKEINEWVRNGGKIIAIGSATNIFKDKEDYGLKSNDKEKEEDASTDDDEILIP